MTNLELLKQGVFAIIDKKQTDNILREQDADFLKKLVDHAETENEVRQILRLGVVARQTGLVFPAKIGREEMTDTLHILKRNDDLSFNQGGSENTLIIGENYHALQNLDIQYHGQVDVIYLDPPYSKDATGCYAQVNYGNNISRDELLSMLHVRLQIARQLLSPDGVIFISIDDKNQAYVKCLMDEVFGEENFVGTFIWKKQGGGKADSKYVAANCEYIITYIAPALKEFNSIEKSDTHYNLKDDKGRYHLEKLDRSSLSYSESLDYIIELDGERYVPGGDEDSFQQRKAGNHRAKDWRWRVSEQEFWKRYNEGLIVGVVDKNGINCIKEKCYLKEDGVKGNIETLLRDKADHIDGQIFGMDDLIDDVTNRTATNEIKNTVGNRAFLYAKPVSLIERLIKLHPNKDAVVLDFFAGSGTTGHAVLEANKDDNGNRSFILCTGDEKTESNPDGIIKEVTTKRLKRIMTGSCYDGSTDFEWIKKNTAYGNSLTVYDLIDVDPHKQGDGNLIDAIHEEDYGMPKMNPADKADWIYRNFQKCLKGEKHD